MITGIRTIQQSKLNVVHPAAEPILFKVKDQKLIPINASGNKPIGLTSIPGAVRKSRFFTGSDLFKLSTLKSIPTKEDIISFMRKNAVPSDKDDQFYHRRSKILIERNEFENALMMSFIPDMIR